MIPPVPRLSEALTHWLPTRPREPRDLQQSQEHQLLEEPRLEVEPV